MTQVEAEVHALLERRRYKQARAALGPALRTNPKHVELRYLAAFVEWAEDQNDVAAELVDELLADSPQHRGARILRAQLCEAAGHRAEAERIWIELLREYPEEPDFYGHYAQLMLDTLKLDKAKALAREGLRFDPENEQCLYVGAIADLVERGETSSNLQTLLLHHPEQMRSSIALVIALSDRGDARGALRVAQELLRYQPDSQPLVELVRELKVATHWSMIPLYPMQRWGWAGAAGVTIAGVVGLRLVSNQVSDTTALVLLGVWIGYLVYSWCWPVVIRKFI